MINFIYSLMTDKRNGLVYTPFKVILYAASVFYGLALLIRRLLYLAGLFRAEKAPLKIISVGNITLGGTGKTPFTIMLAGLVREELKRDPVVLIRGYGWDEQAMLKKNLPDIPILVGEDRLRSADRAVKLYGSSIAILDDGFQHWELKRDLDIVLIDSGNPFGNGHLFPRGILREPRNSLKRADMIVFTKADKKFSAVSVLRQELSSINNRVEFLEAVHKSSHFYDNRQRKELGLDVVNGERVLLVSSIGDPEHFGEAIKALKAHVVDHMVFADHHNYSVSDRNRIVRRAGELKADLIVTTDKDAVKFARMSFSFDNFTVLTLMIRLEITKGKEKLVARLNSLLRG